MIIKSMWMYLGKNISKPKNVIKFAFLTSFLILTCPILTSSVFADTNLVMNPGLESGTTTPLNWAFVNQNGNIPIWDSVSHSGSKSIKISISGTTNRISGYPQSDIIDAQPLTTYIASVWGKTQNTGGSNTPAARVVELDANKNWIRQNNILPVFGRGTNDWTQRTIEFKTDANTRYLYVYANIWNGYGTFWMDDAVLRLKDTPTPTVTVTPTVTATPTVTPKVTAIITPIPTPTNNACSSPITEPYKYRVLKEGSDVNVCDINNRKVYSSTDASESIKWAINSLNSARTSQEKIITQTDLTINSTISPTSLVYLEIRGILRIGGINYDIINFANQHDVTIAGTAGGYGELIGQGKEVGTTGWGIRTQGSNKQNKNIIFKNLKVHNFRQSGIALNQLDGGGLVENVICNDNGQNGIGVGDAIGVTIKNSYCKGNRDSGIQFEDAWNFKALDNQVVANGRHNLQVEHGVGGEITNGIYRNGIGDGIQIRDRAPPDVGVSENIVVSGVESRNNANDGLIIIASKTITVQNGKFNNNGKYGINENSGDYNMIKNNDIRNNTQAAGFRITGLHTVAVGNIIN